MKISNEFRASASVEQAWALLCDLAAIAPCLPGAQLTGQDGDTYQGLMKVKVGPVTAEYKGTARITELDEVNRRVLVSASGRDSRGSGNASAEIDVTMVEDDGGTQVSIDTDLRVSGKVAQFGRGVMADVSKKLIGQFAQCVEAKLDGSATADDDPASDPAASAESSGEGSGEVSGDTAPAESSGEGSGEGSVESPGDGSVESPGDGSVESPGDGSGESPAAASVESPAAASGEQGSDDGTEALDLLDVAGSALAKRLIPVAVAVVAVVAVVVFIVVGRARRPALR